MQVLRVARGFDVPGTAAHCFTICPHILTRESLLFRGRTRSNADETVKGSLAACTAFHLVFHLDLLAASDPGAQMRTCLT